MWTSGRERRETRPRPLFSPHTPALAGRFTLVASCQSRPRLTPLRPADDGGADGDADAAAAAKSVSSCCGRSARKADGIVEIVDTENARVLK